MWCFVETFTYIFASWQNFTQKIWGICTVVPSIWCSLVLGNQTTKKTHKDHASFLIVIVRSIPSTGTVEDTPGVVDSTPGIVDRTSDTIGKCSIYWA